MAEDVSSDLIDGDINNAQLQRYAYADFNPLRYVDPDGLAGERRHSL